jgi:ribosomal-protein-alanine N-acetyltransferase
MIDWGMGSDLHAIVDVDRQASGDPWSINDMAACMTNISNVTRVIRHAVVSDVDIATTSEVSSRTRLVGFECYRSMNGRVTLYKIAVHPDFQRRGVGRLLIDSLRHAMIRNRREYAVTAVRETNLIAQQFFRAVGFRAIGVERAFFPDSGEDAFMMKLDRPTGAELRAFRRRDRKRG